MTAPGSESHAPTEVERYEARAMPGGALVYDCARQQTFCRIDEGDCDWASSALPRAQDIAEKFNSTARPTPPVSVPFQQRVGEWMEQCFTPEIIADKLERADRFIEESLELVQATGYSADRAHALVDYVFARPVGEPFQEVGGVKVTLAALCNPHGINMDAAAEAELARVWTKIEAIRVKQATKPVGSALPVPATLPPNPLIEEVREAAQAIIERKSDTFTARNGRKVGIQGDDGEKCYIVHSDDIFALERALATLGDSHGG